MTDKEIKDLLKRMKKVCKEVCSSKTKAKNFLKGIGLYKNEK